MVPFNWRRRQSKRRMNRLSEHTIMKNNQPLRAFFGHHRCATSWINLISQKICEGINLRFNNVYNPSMFNKDLKSYVKKNNTEFLSYTNANINYVKKLDDFIGFHVIRDPRDIVVSAYYSHLYSHRTKNWPDLVQHREKLKGSTKDEGLLLEMDFSKIVFEDIFTWDYEMPNVYEVKMEDLIKNPYNILVGSFNHLSMVNFNKEITMSIKFLVNRILKKLQRKRIDFLNPFLSIDQIPVDILLRYIYKFRFSQLSGNRLPGEEDIRSHYRKGVAGDWINHFNQEHCEYFKKNYNDLLIKLGYENSTDW